MEITLSMRSPSSAVWVLTQIKTFALEWIFCTCPSILTVYNPSNIFARIWLVITRHKTEYAPAKSGEYLKDYKHNSPYLTSKTCSGLCPRTSLICSSKLTVFLQLSLLWTDIVYGHFAPNGGYSFYDIKTFFSIPRKQNVCSYAFDREVELWLGTTAPSWSSMFCDSMEPFIFKASFSLFSSFFLFFSSSSSVKFSASARLSTAMAKNTLRRMSEERQGTRHDSRTVREFLNLCAAVADFCFTFNREALD